MQKNLLLLATIAFLFYWKTSAQTCLPNGIIFSTQAQIDSFPINYPGCTEVLGYVRVQESNAGAITNLNGLSPITSIGDKLVIQKNAVLTSLMGLGNLTAIGQSLDITGNDALVSLSGLEGLTTIGASLDITSNDALVSLIGLDNLTTIGASLDITSNDALVSLIGLDNLITIGGGQSLTNNHGLTSLTGLGSLTAIGGLLKITGNDALISLSGLGNLKSVGKMQIIEYNNALTSLTGLENLTTIGGRLHIQHNDALTSLSGLTSLTAIGGELRLEYNDALTSLSGLDHIDPTTISSLTLFGSSMLSQCDVQSICDYLANPLNFADIAFNTTGCSNRSQVEAGCAVPVNEVEDNDMAIYPNPTNGIINIKGREMERAAYVVTNLIGSIVKRGTVNSNQIDISELRQGLYFIMLQRNNQTLIRRIVKA